MSQPLPMYKQQRFDPSAFALLAHLLGYRTPTVPGNPSYTHRMLTVYDPDEPKSVQVRG